MYSKIDVIKEIARRKAFNTLLGFTKYTFPQYEIAEHHRTIASALERVERGEIDRLMITVPPRHGKSELASIRFPAWYLGRNPNKRIISASYSGDLTRDFGNKARNIVSSQEYKTIFGMSISKKSSAKNEWDLDNEKGGYYGTGVGGAATGKGAHLFLIDDPLKNRQDANSDTIRKNIFEWYTSTAYTRLEKGGAIVIIMTRWHEDDLVGRLLEEQKKGGEFSENWTLIHLPALSDDGKALWSGKYNERALNRIKENIGSFDFEALYQGRPTPLGGSIIKTSWWKTYTVVPPKFDMIIQTADTAQKTAELNDYSVIGTWGKFDNKIYLLSITRGKWEMPELERMAIAEYNKWKPSKVLIEDKASGTALIQNLRRNYSMPITAVQVSSDKVTRVQEIVGFIESGYVYIPEHAEWVSDYILELSRFPSGAHDDQVDVTSMAIKELMGFNGGGTAIIDFMRMMNDQRLKTEEENNLKLFG